MAFVVMLLSSLAGVVATLVALIGYDVSWGQAFVIYLVWSIVPAAVVMSSLYIYMSLRGIFESGSNALAEMPRAR